jgi:hypothetical protein
LRKAPEAACPSSIYAQLPSMNFSEGVLARAFDRLATVRVKGVAWTDLGSPERLFAFFRSVARLDRHRGRPPSLSAVS